MAAIQAEHFLSAQEQLPDRVPQRAIAEDDPQTAKVLPILRGSHRHPCARSGIAARRDLARVRSAGSLPEPLGGRGGGGGLRLLLAEGIVLLRIILFPLLLAQRRVFSRRF